MTKEHSEGYFGSRADAYLEGISDERKAVLVLLEAELECYNPRERAANPVRQCLSSIIDMIKNGEHVKPKEEDGHP